MEITIITKIKNILTNKKKNKVIVPTPQKIQISSICTDQSNINGTFVQKLQSTQKQKGITL